MFSMRRHGKELESFLAKIKGILQSLFFLLTLCPEKKLNLGVKTPISG